MSETTKATNRLNGTSGADLHGEAVRDPKGVGLAITYPNMAVLSVRIRGTAPLVINRFPQKAIEMMKAAQAAGSQGKKGRKREAKNFDECFEQAKHVSHDGWCGIAAPAFRNAMVDACRLVGFKMTHAKLGVFVEADGFDRLDGTPLVRILGGEPVKVEHPVRNESGVADIRARPMWIHWGAVVRVRYDADMFTVADIGNLMARVGMQVGIGEGRPNSKKTTGQGWGLFEVLDGDTDLTFDGPPPAA